MRATGPAGDVDGCAPQCTAGFTNIAWSPTSNCVYLQAGHVNGQPLGTCPLSIPLPPCSCARCTQTVQLSLRCRLRRRRLLSS